MIVVAVLVVWFLWSLFQPFHGEGSGKVAVTIPKGSSVSEVGELLAEKGVIEGGYLFGVVDASTLFQMRVTLAGKRSDLYAGHFTLEHDMSYGAAIDALSQPPRKRVVDGDDPRGLQPLAGGGAGRRRRRPRQLHEERRSSRSTSTRPNTAARRRRTSRASSSPTPSN